MEELNIPYELLPVMPASKDVFQHNPSGKVPTLLVEENEVGLGENRPLFFAVTESPVINTFLGDRFPDSGLVPKPLSHDRLLYDQLIMKIMTELDEPLWMNRKHTELGKIFGYIPKMKEASLRQFKRANKIISMELERSGGPFLMGSQFTAADILYVHCLDWAKKNGWQDALRSEMVANYFDVCRERPAYQCARELRKNDPNAKLAETYPSDEVQACANPFK
eukprot:scaffold3430_cov162-Amphora_coffeaeformis.AAC.6